MIERLNHVAIAVPDLEAAVRGRTVVLATHAALPPGAVGRCLELRAGRLHELSSGAAILA